jgi:hypothetical protein
MKFYRANYESTNFSFEAYASTQDDAKKQMVKGLKTHTKQYKLLNNDWWIEDDIGVNEVELNKSYRDHSEL